MRQISKHNVQKMNAKITQQCENAYLKAHPYSDATVKAVSQINFNGPAKHVFTKNGLAKALDAAQPGQVISYYGTRMAALDKWTHWRYFMVTKDTLAYHFILGVGNAKVNNILRIHHAITIFITKIIAVHGKKRNYIRYEFKANHHNYWVTAREDYVPNSYLQNRDFARRDAHYVKVIRPCRLYIDRHYNNKTLVSNVRGGIFHVKKVIFINHPSWEQTRLVLTNGNYITANKNFVKIIK